MPTSQLPPAVEISRLWRLKEAVLGGEFERRSLIVATDDWIAEVDARLAALEQAVLPPIRVSS